MNDAVQAELRSLLTDQRQQAQHQIAALTQSFDEIVEAVESSNNDDEHDPEGTTIAFERAQVSALLAQARADLDAVDEAMNKMTNGDYGVCEACHGPISVERLRAIPSTVRCIRCA